MGTIVLGHYPEYCSLAKRIGAEYFNMPKDEWDKMDDASRWAANQKFLDEAIARGDEIVLSSMLRHSGSWFERELEYLAGKGYTPARRGRRIALVREK